MDRAAGCRRGSSRAPVRTRSNLPLRSLRRLRHLRRLRRLRRLRLLPRSVERDRLAYERLERGRIDLLALVDVDRAADVALEARVEQPLGILQRRALREGELHDLLVRLTGADDALVRPDRRPHPLPLLDD